MSKTGKGLSGMQLLSLAGFAACLMLGVWMWREGLFTSQERLDDLVWVDIRTSMFAVVSSCVRRVGSIIESDRRTKGKQVLTFVIK